MDISILRYLDVLIGIAVVMALASSFVTLLTQFVLSMGNRRAELLEKGVAYLLIRAEPTLANHANEIAKAVVQWQTASGKAGGKRQVIVREQLVRMLLEIVSDPTDSVGGIPKEAKSALAKLFSNQEGQKDGTASAGKLLEVIDRKVCAMEAEHPEFPTHVIHTRAINEANAGKFVDAIMTRFDNMSESLTTIFTANSRQVTFLVSLLVALALPLDTIDLLQRLSSDDKLRESLVTKAIEESGSYDRAVLPTQPADSTATGKTSKQQDTTPVNQASTPAKSNTDTLASIDFDAVNKAYKELNNPNLSLVSRGGWPKILLFDQPSLAYYLEFIFGCFLSALLMTIGAPFWFETLKNLLKLRPSLAQADDEARETRRNAETKDQK